MSADISVSFLKWVWRPPIVCKLDITFPSWTVRDWTVIQYTGDTGYSLLAPSQKSYDVDSKVYTPILEWHDPSDQFRFQDLIAEKIKEKSHINLNSRDDMVYMWHFYAGAKRTDKAIISKYGIKKLPPSKRNQ